MGTLAILRMGSTRQQEELLPKIASGKLILTAAFCEPGIGYELDHMDLWPATVRGTPIRCA